MDNISSLYRYSTASMYVNTGQLFDVQIVCMTRQSKYFV